MKTPKMLMMIIIAIIGLVLLYCLRGMIIYSLQDGSAIPVTRTNFTVIAHRGASGHAPENTIPAFLTALDMGADWIELDVHLSKDGVPIVIHDATLERTTNGQGTVSDASWLDLSKLDAGSWYGEEFARTPIPSLRQVLDTIGDRATLLIELKVDGQGQLYKGLVDSVLSDIQEANSSKYCILQAFSSEYLKEIKDSQTSIPYHKLIIDEYSPLPFYTDEKWQWGYLNDSLYYQAVNPYFKTLTSGRIASRQRAGYKVYPYTVNQESDMRLLIHWGVNGIITNYPDIALSLRKEASKL